MESLDMQIHNAIQKLRAKLGDDESNDVLQALIKETGSAHNEKLLAGLLAACKERREI